MDPHVEWTVAGTGKGGVPLGYCVDVDFHCERDGGYWVSIARLPGCLSQGDTLEEAKANIAEAFALCVSVYEENGGKIPWTEPRPPRRGAKRIRMALNPYAS